MKVRAAEAGDLDRLLELYDLLEGPYLWTDALCREDSRRLFMRVLADPDQTTLVAEEDGWLVGTLVLIVVPNLAHGGSPYAVVENLVVEESRQGRGIGKALILEAMYRARRSGAYKLSLTSNTKRAESHELYRRLGFRETHLGFEVDP